MSVSRLFLHALIYFLLLCPAASFADETSWQAAMRLGWSAYQRGDYTKAEKQFDRALKEAKESGKRNPRLAESLHSLAELYKVQGRYAEAEPLYQRALRIREKALGPAHPVVAASLTDMAALYRATKHIHEAKALETRAARIRAIKR